MKKKNVVLIQDGQAFLIREVENPERYVHDEDVVGIFKSEKAAHRQAAKLTKQKIKDLNTYLKYHQKEMTK